MFSDDIGLARALGLTLFRCHHLQIAPAVAPLRTGLGRIESILAVPTAAAGGTASNSTRRIVMKMDDGSVQYFDTQAAGLATGDRIEITKDGTMRHPA